MRTSIIAVLVLAVVALAACSTMTTTTTATDPVTGVTTTTTQDSWTVNTDQLTAIVGAAAGAADVVAAYQQATAEPVDTSPSVQDQLLQAGLEYLTDYLANAGAAPVTKAPMTRDVMLARSTDIAMMAFKEAGTVPGPGEIAVYVVTGSEPTEAELIEFGRTGRLAKAQ